ncbi:MAG: adenylyltransferase/cytidyltransferase family protein [Anaerovoracaceae bacterium]
MKKVITYGTFDLFHQGHYNIIKRAKEHGDYLIVAVTSESYDIERGKLSVQDSLTKRIENVKATGLVDEVIIEEYLGQKIRDVIKYDIDTLVIGSDWLGKFDHLKKLCNVVYLERTKNISSTQIREESNNTFNLGIVTDNTDDNDVISESKYVSGIHADKVYSSKQDLAQKYCDKFQLNEYCTDYDEFLEGLSIVYINASVDQRYELIKRAMKAGKHVICDSPFAMKEKKVKELFEIAKKEKVALIENIITVYLRAFTQLLWMAQGDMIGNTISVKCSISYDNFEHKNGFNDMLTLSTAMIMKILGTNYKKFDYTMIDNEKGRLNYGVLNFKYDNAVGIVEIGNEVELDNHLVVIGDAATITVKDDWWDTGYFELMAKDAKHPKKYSFNFEGSGFRYILQELLIMMRDNRSECTRLFTEESLGIVKVLEKLDLENKPNF